jgi:WhiB family redox-sensing transcriptional regulator
MTATNKGAIIIKDLDTLIARTEYLRPWQDEAACRGADGALFFASDPERRASRSRREARAKAICQRCPVIEQCLAFALRVEEPCGIWGGLSEDERARVVTDRR